MIRLLLTDDSQETIETLQVLYGNHPNFEIVGCAYNADETWKIIREKSVDIASLDIQLGHDDGIELCHQIHSEFPEIFIVMCSLEASEETRRRSKEAGASHFISKPMRSKDVHEIVERYYGRHNNSNESSQNETDDWIKDLLASLT